MKKYIKPAIKRVEMQHFCDGDTVMPEISIYNEQGDEGGFAEENGFFEEENDAYNTNLRNLNVWEK